MKDETVSGLRSAMEHGASLEQAVNSFINAGYNPQEVQAAAEVISSGVSQIVHTPEKKVPAVEQDSTSNGLRNLPPGPTKEGVAPSAPVGNEMVGKKQDSGKTLILIILIIVLMVVLGGIGWLMYSFLKS